MTRPSTRSRRELLCATTGVLALAAGCIAEDDPLSDDDADGDDADEKANSGGSDDGDEAADGTGEDDGTDSGFDDYETHQFSTPDAPTEPDGALFLDREDAEEWVTERSLDDEESLTEFVSETSFDESTLVALEADAPTPCYELDIEDVAIEDGALTIESAVRDAAEDDEMCAQRETTVGALVRATPPDGPVNEVSATIVDRNGAEHAFGIGVDRASDETSGTEGSDSASDTDDESDSE